MAERSPEEYQALLQSIVRDSALVTLDPMTIIPNLQLHGLITDDEREVILQSPTIADRKLALFHDILPTKHQEAVVDAMRMIADELGIQRLSKLVSEFFENCEPEKGTMTQQPKPRVTTFDPRKRIGISDYWDKVLKNISELKQSSAFKLVKSVNSQVEYVANSRALKILLQAEEDPGGTGSGTERKRVWISKTSAFLDRKRQETLVLEPWLKKLNSMKVPIVKQSRDLEQFVSNQVMILFVIEVPERPDNFVNELASLEETRSTKLYPNLNGSDVTNHNAQKENCWFHDRPIIFHMKDKLSDFVSMKQNEANSAVDFFAMDLEMAISLSQGAFKKSGRGACIAVYTPDTAPYVFDLEMYAPRPNNIRFDFVTHNTIKVKWDNSSTEPPKKYQIYLREVPKKKWDFVGVSEDVKSFPIKNLKPTTQYEFLVRAHYHNSFVTDGPSDKIWTKPAPTSTVALKLKSKSHQISEGPPALFKLPLVDMEVGDTKSNSRKYSIGSSPQSPIQEQEKVVLLIGETGSGKTTIINECANFLYGVQPKDGFRFCVAEENRRKSRALSQTEQIVSYTLHPFEGVEGGKVCYRITFVDTPGFGDVGGIESDTILRKHIASFFEGGASGMDELHMVLLVIQSSSVRLTASKRHVFEWILSLFGEDVKENIFVIFSFADVSEPLALDAVKAADIPYVDYFKFNVVDHGSEEADKIANVIAKMNEQSFAEILRNLEVVESTSLKQSTDVLRLRDRLQSVVIELQRQIVGRLDTTKTIKDEKNIIEKYQKAEADREFPTTTLRPVEESLRDQEYYPTYCKRCAMICHSECKASEKHLCNVMKDSEESAEANQAGWPAFAESTKNITVTPQQMERLHCVMCPKLCHWSHHVTHSVKLTVHVAEGTAKPKEIQKKLKNSAIDGAEETQAEFLQRKSKSVRDLEEKLNWQMEQINKNLKEAQNCLDHLRRIALRPVPITELGYIDVLIENEKIKMSNGWTDRIKQLESLKKQAETVTKLSRDRNYSPVEDN